MDEFLAEVRAYARNLGVRPTTVVQRAANVSGLTWANWSRRLSSPTARTMDRVRLYMRENPPLAVTVEARS